MASTVQGTTGTTSQRKQTRASSSVDQPMIENQQKIIEAQPDSVWCGRFCTAEDMIRTRNPHLSTENRRLRTFEYLKSLCHGREALESLLAFEQTYYDRGEMDVLPKTSPKRRATSVTEAALEDAYTILSSVPIASYFEDESILSEYLEPESFIEQPGPSQTRITFDDQLGNPPSDPENEEKHRVRTVTKFDQEKATKRQQPSFIQSSFTAPKPTRTSLLRQTMNQEAGRKGQGVDDQRKNAPKGRDTRRTSTGQPTVEPIRNPSIRHKENIREEHHHAPKPKRVSRQLSHAILPSSTLPISAGTNSDKTPAKRRNATPGRGDNSFWNSEILGPDKRKVRTSSTMPTDLPFVPITAQSRRASYCKHSGSEASIKNQSSTSKVTHTPAQLKLPTDGKRVVTNLRLTSTTRVAREVSRIVEVTPKGVNSKGKSKAIEPASPSPTDSEFQDSAANPSHLSALQSSTAPKDNKAPAITCQKGKKLTSKPLKEFDGNVAGERSRMAGFRIVRNASILERRATRSPNMTTAKPVANVLRKESNQKIGKDGSRNMSESVGQRIISRSRGAEETGKRARKIRRSDISLPVKDSFRNATGGANLSMSVVDIKPSVDDTPGSVVPQITNGIRNISGQLATILKGKGKAKMRPSPHITNPKRRPAPTTSTSGSLFTRLISKGTKASRDKSSTVTPSKATSKTENSISVEVPPTPSSTLPTAPATPFSSYDLTSDSSVNMEDPDDLESGYANWFLRALIPDETLPGSVNLFEIRNFILQLKIESNNARKAAEEAKIANANVQTIKIKLMKRLDEWSSFMNSCAGEGLSTTRA